MTNEARLSTAELIGIAQVYATLALVEATASAGLTFTQSKQNHLNAAHLLKAKAQLVIEQAERRGLPEATNERN